MKVIDLRTHENVELTLFPDNQPHIRLKNINRGDEVHVVVPLKGSLSMMHLLQITNALDRIGNINKRSLFIPYLMGSRYDRIMEYGDSLDIEVVANLINSCNFKNVVLYDVHSDVSTALIKNSINLNNEMLIRKYVENIKFYGRKQGSVLICPDAGASKKIPSYLKYGNGEFDEVVYVNKLRDKGGNLTIDVLQPEKCEGRECVIIDDICDGGGTFLGIASQINPSNLTLIVSHAIFSKGTRQLLNKFDKIYTTNSYSCGWENKRIEVMEL
jgi:ribose-phosphate pyrophosphokinase